MNQTIDTTAAAALGAALGDPKAVHDGAKPFAVVPEGFRLESLESTLPAPVRASGTVALRDAQCFIDFVQRYRSEATMLYGTVNPPAFKAVFNDHEAGAPGWRDHVATYNCPLSVEWGVWSKADGKQMAQADFAKFIEDNAPDIATPPAADMIEISRTLEAKKKVNFASGVRLDNGQTEFTYEEEIQGTASKGRLQIPQTFTIGVAVLEGGPKYAMNARLRYRIGDKGALVLWYDLERPHKILEDAVREVREFIQSALGVRVFNGG